MVFETVRECLVSALDLTSEEALHVDQNTAAADLIKWDSAGHFMLIVELEERFGIQFEDEEIVQLGSVPAILKSVASKQ